MRRIIPAGTRATLAAVALLWLSLAGVAWGHGHCHVQGWQCTSTSVLPALPTTYPDNSLGAFMFKFPLKTVIPPPGDHGCIYETSDVTYVAIRFTYTGTMKWEHIQIAGSDLNPVIISTSDRGWGIVEGFHLEPHQGATAEPGPTEVKLPFAAPQDFPITLFTPSNSFTITSATAEVRGNHYYLLPEPGSLLTLGSGLVALGGMAIRRRRR